MRDGMTEWRGEGYHEDHHAVMEFREVPRPPTERWCECCGDSVVGNAKIVHDFCAAGDCDACQDPACPCCGMTGVLTAVLGLGGETGGETA